MNKRVLVTGGCGFIGTNLVNRLLEYGATVSVLDDLSTGVNGLYENRNVEFIQGSVENKDLVFGMVSQAEIVYHLAARNIMASTKSPYDDQRTNIYGTLNVLMACREHPVERVVYTSSASIYGNAKYLPINEDDIPNLLTPYAVSKYTGEGYCTAFHESYDIPATILRLSNVYGPFQNPTNPYCGVVAKFFDKALRGEMVDIHGDGLSTRDFTYVSDVVQALILAGTHPRAEGEVFNVATGIETSIFNLANNIISMCKEFDDDETAEFIENRDIDNIRRRVLNIEKIRRMLGWSPRYPLFLGLHFTKDWLDSL